MTTGIIDLVPGPLGKGELDGAAAAGDPGAAARVRPSSPPAAAPSDDEDARRPRCGPARPRWWRARAPTPYGCWPRCCRRLLPAGLERRAELRTLGVGRLPLGDAIERIAGAERTPTGGGGSTTASPGSTRTGCPGCPCRWPTGVRRSGPGRSCCPPPSAEAAPEPTLARLGLKVAHPDAVHPLLEKLGALPATPRAVLTTPQVRAAVAASLDAGGRSGTRTRTPGRRGTGRDRPRAGPGRRPRTRGRALARRARPARRGRRAGPGRRTRAARQPVRRR